MWTNFIRLSFVLWLFVCYFADHCDYTYMYDYPQTLMNKINTFKPKRQVFMNKKTVKSVSTVSHNLNFKERRRYCNTFYNFKSEWVYNCCSAWAIELLDLGCLSSAINSNDTSLWTQASLLQTPLYWQFELQGKQYLLRVINKA